MSPHRKQRNKSNSSRLCARASLWIIRLAFVLSFVWHTEERSMMRKFVLSALFLAVGSAAALVPAALADDAPKAAAADQPRTMEDVINRVVTNENHLYGKVKDHGSRVHAAPRPLSRGVLRLPGSRHGPLLPLHEEQQRAGPPRIRRCLH